MPHQPATRQTYLVEHYQPGLDADALQRYAARVRTAAAELRREGKRVCLLRSTIVGGEESLLCLFETGSEELVRAVYSRAAIRVDRIRQ